VGGRNPPLADSPGSAGGAPGTRASQPRPSRARPSAAPPPHKALAAA